MTLSQIIEDLLSIITTSNIVLVESCKILLLQNEKKKKNRHSYNNENRFLYENVLYRRQIILL